MRPMINALALLYHYLFLNYGLSIIVFTVIVRVLMIPLTIRQTRQMKKLQTLQPRMKGDTRQIQGQERFGEPQSAI